MRRQDLRLGIAVDAVFVVQALLSILMIRRMQADEVHWADQPRPAPPTITTPPSIPVWPGDVRRETKRPSSEP